VADINKNPVNQMCRDELLDSITVLALREVLRLHLLNSKNLLPLYQYCLEKHFQVLQSIPLFSRYVFRKILQLPSSGKGVIKSMPFMALRTFIEETSLGKTIKTIGVGC
jgi:hypothetical protein